MRKCAVMLCADMLCSSCNACVLQLQCLLMLLQCDPWVVKLHVFRSAAHGQGAENVLCALWLEVMAGLYSWSKEVARYPLVRKGGAFMRRRMRQRA